MPSAWEATCLGVGVNATSAEALPSHPGKTSLTRLQTPFIPGFSLTSVTALIAT